MRVAQICADRGIAPGGTKGASLHMRGVANGLQANGHEVVTFAARRQESPFPAPVLEFGPLLPLDEQLAVTGPFSLLYERYSLGHTAGLEAAHRAHRPFMLEVNAPLVDEALKYRPNTVTDRDLAAEQRLLREADLITVVSQPLAEWVTAIRGDADGVHVIPNGFEPAWFADAASLAPGSPMVFLGHPKPWHGGDLLAPLLLRLAHQHLRPGLLIIGGGPGVDPILTDARRYGVFDQVEVTGPVPSHEAARLAATASIGLAPYPDHDPFYFCPLKIIDYLAAGLPIVATAAGDIPTLVGDAGLLLEADDRAGFADAVASLLRNPLRAAVLGKRGRTRAHRTHTWAIVASQIIEAARSLSVTR